MKRNILVFFLSIALFAQEKVSLSYNIPDNLEVSYATHLQIEIPILMDIDMTVKSTSFVKQKNKEYEIRNRVTHVSGVTKVAGEEEKIDSESPEFGQTSTGREMVGFLNKDITALYNLQGEFLSRASGEQEPQDPLMRIVFPLEPLSVGDSWTSEEDFADLGFAISFLYTLSKITPDKVFINLSMSEDWDLQGTRVENFNGVMEIDKATGLLNQSNMGFVVRIPEDEVKMNLNMSIKRQ